ncbi:MAG: hypothetical protein L0241_22425 [Planctomycetia bacterium]|nr:hypothetical protein [Planctomycetia bacterium]
MKPDDPFIQDALSEEGIPITAGYVPADGKAPPSDAERPLTPVWEAIGKLPRWARVAFAARCARRVLPLFAERRRNQDWFAKLAHAVRVAEEFASQAKVGSDIADRPLFAAQDVQGEAPFSHAAYAAHVAAHSRGNPADITQRATEAASTACRLLAEEPHWREKGPEVESEQVPFTETPTQDLVRLLRRAKEQNWTDDTPVPPEVFGPMWEGEPPHWWREIDIAKTPPEVEPQSLAPKPKKRPKRKPGGAK